MLNLKKILPFVAFAVLFWYFLKATIGILKR